MSHKHLTALSVAAALSSAISFSALTTPAAAMDDGMGMMSEHAYDGRCWGISKAGENDCGSKAQELKATFGLDAPSTAHDCAGLATQSYDGLDFKKVKAADDCTGMHGSLTPFVGMNDKMDM